MSTPVFQQMIALANQLSDDERKRLIDYLQAQASPQPITRRQLMAEFERKKIAGVFKGNQGLAGKYISETDVEVSDAELDTYLNEIQAAWKADLG